MQYVSLNPPLYTEPCAASSRMKNPSPMLIIGRLRGVSLERRDSVSICVMVNQAPPFAYMVCTAIENNSPQRLKYTCQPPLFDQEHRIGILAPSSRFSIKLKSARLMATNAIFWTELIDATAIYAKNTDRNQPSRRKERAGEMILIPSTNTAARTRARTSVTITIVLYSPFLFLDSGRYLTSPASSPSFDSPTISAAAEIAAVARPISFAGIVLAATIQKRRPKNAPTAELSIRAMELQYKGSV
jgi:hypothetical protein